MAEICPTLTRLTSLSPRQPPPGAGCDHTAAAVTPYPLSSLPAPRRFRVGSEELADLDFQIPAANSQRAARTSSAENQVTLPKEEIACARTSQSQKRATTPPILLRLISVHLACSRGTTGVLIGSKLTSTG